MSILLLWRSLKTAGSMSHLECWWLWTRSFLGKYMKPGIKDNNCIAEIPLSLVSFARKTAGFLLCTWVHLFWPASFLFLLSICPGVYCTGGGGGVIRACGWHCSWHGVWTACFQSKVNNLVFDRCRIKFRTGKINISRFFGSTWNLHSKWTTTLTQIKCSQVDVPPWTLVVLERNDFQEARETFWQRDNNVADSFRNLVSFGWKSAELLLSI